MILILKTKSRGNFQLSTYLNVFEDSDKLDRAGDTQAICVDIKLRSNWFQSKEFQLTTARQPCRGKTWGGCGKFYRHQGGGGDQGDQTGAKQIIGRLQVGKTIGQLD